MLQLVVGRRPFGNLMCYRKNHETEGINLLESLSAISMQQCKLLWYRASLNVNLLGDGRQNLSTP